MTSTYVTDANVILRYLLADHPKHAKAAQEFMGRVRRGEIRAHITEGVVVECVYVLLKLYGVPRPEVANKLLAVLSFRGIVADNLGILAQALRVFAERNVDIVDAIVHVTAQQRGWEAFSFDSDVRKLRGK